MSPAESTYEESHVVSGLNGERPARPQRALGDRRPLEPPTPLRGLAVPRRAARHSSSARRKSPPSTRAPRVRRRSSTRRRAGRRAISDGAGGVQRFEVAEDPWSRRDAATGRPATTPQVEPAQQSGPAVGEPRRDRRGVKLENPVVLHDAHMLAGGRRGDRKYAHSERRRGQPARDVSRRGRGERGSGRARGPRPACCQGRRVWIIGDYLYGRRRRAVHALATLDRRARPVVRARRPRRPPSHRVWRVPAECIALELLA